MRRHPHAHSDPSETDPQAHSDQLDNVIASTVRQIAIRNIGRDQPTLLITSEVVTQAKDLLARYTERMIIENERGTCSGGFHLDALTSAIPRNVDLDTTLTCGLNLRSHHPILIDAGYANLDIFIPWWNDRTLRFRFRPR
jgi:hypothetical protein